MDCGVSFANVLMHNQELPVSHPCSDEKRGPMRDSYEKWMEDAFLNNGLTSTSYVVKPRKSSAETVVLTPELLKEHFHLPLGAAAKKLGVCTTALKQGCRKIGLKHWPHRLLATIAKERAVKGGEISFSAEPSSHNVITDSWKSVGGDFATDWRATTGADARQDACVHPYVYPRAVDSSSKLTRHDAAEDARESHDMSHNQSGFQEWVHAVQLDPSSPLLSPAQDSSSAASSCGSFGVADAHAWGREEEEEEGRVAGRSPVDMQGLIGEYTGLLSQVLDAQAQIAAELQEHDRLEEEVSRLASQLR